MERKVLALVSAVLVFGLLSEASAVNQIANSGGGTDWNNPAIWEDTLVPDASKDYHTNGYYLRTVEDDPGGVDTFLGNTLTLGGGAGWGPGKLMVKLKANDPTTCAANIIFDGGYIESANDGIQIFDGTMEVLAAGGAFRQRGRGGFRRQLHVDAIISGSGPIAIYCDDLGDTYHGDVYLNSANPYNGTWTVGGPGKHQTDVFFTGLGSLGNNASLVVDENGVVDIDYNVSFDVGTLTINTGGLLILDQDHNFVAISLAGDSLAVGTYDYAALDAMGYGALVTDDGGSLAIAGVHPTIGFDSGSSSDLESVTPAELTVTLISAEAGQTYTVDYAATGGTATGGGVDYTLEPGTLTFNPGETTQTISIDIVDDGLDEEHETIIVELSNPTGPDVVLGINEHTYTILDPRSTVAFDTEGSSETEDAGTIEITVSLSFATTLTVTVDYAATGGTATGGGVDYTLEPGTLTFNPGETSKTISVELVDDGVYEAPETVEITLSNPTNANLGAITEHTLEICTPLADLTALEWGTDIIAATNSSSHGGTWAAKYAINGGGMVSANEHGSWGTPGDGTPEHSWMADGILGNWIQFDFARPYRLAEMWVWNGSYKYRLFGGSIKGCTIEYYDGLAWQTLMTIELASWDGSSPYQRTNVISFGRVTAEKVRLNTLSTYGSEDVILSEVRFYVSEKPSVAFGSTYSSALETESPVLLNVDLLFIKEEGQTYTVDYAVTGGTATAGVDYLIATGGPACWNSATQCHGDTDATGDVKGSDFLALKGSWFKCDPDPNYNPCADFDRDGCVKGSDFLILKSNWYQTVEANCPIESGATLEFAPGETTKTITIDIVDEGLDEEDETIVVGLSNPTSTGAEIVLGEPNQHIYTIQDPRPAVGFETDSSSGRENVTPVDITVSLSFASDKTITVDYEVTGGTATGGGVDYTLLDGGTLTFNPGETTKTFSIAIVDDGMDEDNETIVITLSNPVNAKLAAITEFTYTIVDPSIIHLKVDLAHPIAEGSSEPRPGTAKEGWTAWTAPRWWDMYMHDFVTLGNIDGTGIGAGISMAREGNGGLKVYDMCMENKAGGPPHGSPVGDPIANTWYYNVDWGGNPRGNVVLILYCLPPGQYTLTSYHNFWIFCSSGSRECTKCVPSMPAMPRIWAIGLIDADPGALGLPGYDKLVNAAGDCLGNPGGVELIEDATNVMYTTTLNDDEVATSQITFRTDGSAVLVIYEGPHGWTDPRGRDGGRGILNAFELQLVGP